MPVAVSLMQIAAKHYWSIIDHTSASNACIKPHR